MGFASELVCGCGGALLVALVVASFLRLAVIATNKLFGPARTRAPASGGIAEWDWDDWDDEYATAARPWREPGREPGIPKCVVVVLVAVLAFGVGFFAMGMVAKELLGVQMWRDDSQLFVAFLNFPVADLALTVMLIILLPTTFWRAAMVTFLFNLILLVAILCCGAIVFILAKGLG